MQIKQTKLQVIRGDITGLDVQAIVNSANTDMSMSDGLAKVILQAGGAAIEEEARSLAPIPVGEAIVTSGGNLTAEYVIHAAVMQQGGSVDQESLRSAIANALKEADALEVSSIAFPALGCGIGNFPLAGAAKILFQEIFKVCQHTPTHLREVTICLFNDEMFHSFQETIQGYYNHIKDDLGPGPYVTTDIIIEMDGGIVLIERSNPPYGWALPGGFLDYGESLEECAAREAKEETALDLKDLRQMHTYSAMGRDPRFQTISTVFIAQGVGEPQSGDDAKNLKIVLHDDLPTLDYAFDHKKVIHDYLTQRKRN